MMFQPRQIVANDYNIIDVILWSFGLALSVISILYSVLAYHFSSKSTRLLQEHIEKTWLITESNKLFFENMKILKRACTTIIFHLKEENNITYHKYNLISAGSRIIHVNKETVQIFQRTKFKGIIDFYLAEKEKFDVHFFNIVDLEKIISNSNEIIDAQAIKELIEYNTRLLHFGSEILRRFTELTI